MPVYRNDADIVGGGTANPMTTAGDSIVGGVSGVPTRLPIGTNGQVLTVVGGTKAWATPVDNQAIQNLTFSAAQTWNVASLENATVTLTANMTSLTVTGAIAGHCYTLQLLQDATGSRLITFGSSFKFPGGVVPSLTTAANARDVLTLFFNGTNFNAILTKDFK